MIIRIKDIIDIKTDVTITKEEFIKLLDDNIPDGSFLVNSPDDLDNFYTDYSIKIVKPQDTI